MLSFFFFFFVKKYNYWGKKNCFELGFEILLYIFLVLSRGGEKSQGGIWCHRREGWRLGGAHESQSRLGKGIEVGLLRLTGVGELLGIV